MADTVDGVVTGRRRSRLALAVVAVAALSLPGRPAMAAAAEPALPALEPTALTGLLLDLSTDFVSWTNDVTAPILPETELAPGETESSVVGVRNETDGPVRVSLRARNIEEDGQLGGHLRFTVTRDPERDGTFEAEPVFAGTLDRLSEGASLADVALPVHSAWDYRVEATIDRDAANEVQGDKVAFDLAWSSTAEDGDIATIIGPAAGGTDSKDANAADPGATVLGETLQNETAALGHHLLPVTGTGLGLLLGGGFGLVMAGLLLRRARRQDVTR